jgi:hypothetical protein
METIFVNLIQIGTRILGISVCNFFVSNLPRIVMIVFDPGKPFEASLMFVKRSEAYPSESPIRCSILREAPGLFLHH